MWSESRSVMARTTAAVALTLVAVGCDEPKPAPAPAKTAEPAPPPPPTAQPSAPAPSASAATPVHDCPKDAPGDGTFAKPCEAKGKVRMMELSWNGKIDDKGPFFNVTNKTSAPVLYGRVGVYFYDKAGKQMEIARPEGADAGAAGAKAKMFLTCGGMIPGGVMKVGEKAKIQFPCVGKSAVPEGATAIEAEMQMVGYADSTEKKVDYYVRNMELTPDTRKKGAK
jgi:hypothetical protein